MAKFGKRFKKARTARQNRRGNAWAAFQEGRSSRVQSRQTGKTDRKISDNLAKVGVAQARSDTRQAFFAPENVQSRQATITQAIPLLGAAISPMGALASETLGQFASTSPYGNGFATSGNESLYADPSGEITQPLSIEEWIKENMVIVGVGGMALLYILTRKKPRYRNGNDY